jgi:Protein of unknown function (DUF3017)
MRHSAGGPARRRAGRSSGGAPGTRRRTTGQEPGAGAAIPGTAIGIGRPAQIPYWLTLSGVVVLLVLMGERALSIRGGTLAVAGIVLAAALARIVLPERRAGMLVSRRRLVDVAVLTALGAGLLIAGLVLPPQS